ncbi:MAG: Receiver protein of a two-component response regulator [Flavipsychrobacter sp.]|nr:Receiver protein of a two-component response regulator [Flavipsychrobacter sp.]
MKEAMIDDFIVIDDDRINNIISLKIIEITIPGSIVHTFTDPEKGLEYILSRYADPGVKNAILFLDINMPSLSGWDVLDVLENAPAPLKEHVKIFMLSSSVDAKDREKANSRPLVSGYVSKSLSQAKLQAILAEHAQLHA